MQRLLSLSRAIVSRKRLLPTLVVLLGMAFLARLGFWQLDRLEQRRASNAALRQALDAPAFELTGEQLLGAPEQLKDQNVFVRGEYDFERQLALKLQNWGGRTGVHLITPLRIAGSEVAVLVDRGWIPASEPGSADWSAYDEPGLVTVNGYVALSQTLSRPESGDSRAADPHVEWYRVDIEAIQYQMPYQLLPFYVSEAPAAGGDTELPYRSEREIDLSEGPHMGYAIQWFLFSLMLGVIYLVYVNKSLPTTSTEA